jgi:acyl-[acyl-carrier-protein]-phospholipid O-acyltransferase/long-chain-fatty-acid--[acyl-carrier-protein] ligase
VDEPAPAIPAAAFPALLVARGLTVVNDNLLRWLAIGLGKRAAGAAGTALVLTIGTAGFVLPFVALAWLAGWLADRYPKRTVVVWCKVAEILIVGAAAATMAWNTRPGGAFAGWTGTVPAAVALVGIAAAGWLASLRLAARPAADPQAPPPFNALGRTWGDLRDLFAVPELLASGLGIVFFWALGAVAQLNVDQYVAEAGASSQGQAVPMLLALVVGIGLGSVTAGRLSVGGVNLGLVPVGGLLMAVASLALALGPATIFTPDGIRPWAWGFAVVLLGLLGFGAGMFDVPLEAHYQDRSPEQRRGGLLAGLNLLTFAGMMIASLLYGLLRTPTDQPSASLPPGLWLLLGTVVLIGCQAALIAPAMIGSISESVPRTALSGANGVFALVSLAATLVGMAAGNFLSDASGAAAAAAADGTAAAVPLVSARGVFGIFALLSVGAAAAAVWCAPRATLRMVVSTIVHAGYRFRVENTAAMPATGPVVVVANHVSWLDGFLVTLASPRPIRMVVYGPNIQGRFLRMLADQWRFILFDPRPKSIGTALKTMQVGLRDGDVVGIFSEGGIARTGQVLGFKRGLGWLLERVEAPIQPLSIDGLWGSRFSFSEGRFFGTKRSSRWRRPVTLTFGPPLPVGAPPEMARLALQELAASAVRRRLVAGARGSSGGANAGPLDDAVLGAMAEAFDGACLVKPGDVLVSSLAEADPLGRSFGPRAARLLGIRGDAIEPTDDAGHLASALQSQAATIWLASVAQVEALTTTPDTISLPAGLDAVVIPIVGPAAHSRAQAAAAAFQRRYRIEPVTALAVAGGQALVAMNTPAARVPAGHDVPLRPESLGRVVNGAVVWPEAHQRAAIGLPPVPGIAPNDSRCLVIGAMLPRAADGPPPAEPAALLLDDRLAIDADGFLVEGAA